MRTTPRPRRYVSAGTLSFCRPLIAFDYGRDAYVLRGLGDRRGPVLREDRRRGKLRVYEGPERRSSPAAEGVGIAFED